MGLANAPLLLMGAANDPLFEDTLPLMLNGSPAPLVPFGVNSKMTLPVESCTVNVLARAAIADSPSVSVLAIRFIVSLNAKLSVAPPPPTPMVNSALAVFWASELPGTGA